MTAKVRYSYNSGLQHIIPDENIRNELGLTNHYLGESNINSKVIYVKDYGAKGDGIKNDFSAIKKALTALKHMPEGTTLMFEPNSVYYVSSGKYAIDIKELHDVNICGNNSTVLVKPIMGLCKIQKCKNVTFKGFKLDYKTKPYAIADVISVFEDGLIRIRTDKSLNIRGTYKQPVPDYFGLVDRPDSRYHVGITTYKVVNADQNIYDVKCNNIFEQRDLRIDMMKNEKFKFLVPMPHVGQVIERAITIVENENIIIKDLEVCSAAKYMFYLTGNKGKILFKEVNVNKNLNEDNKPIVGWRDGFYCIDNKAQLIWDNCGIELFCDDIINISASMLQVQQIRDDIISLYCQSTGMPYIYAEPGDEISFYNIDSGEELGCTKIKKVTVYDSHIDVLLDKDIPGLCPSPSSKAVVNSLCSPNSIIKNCKFNGTFRFHGPIYIFDSLIHIIRMWIGFEPPTLGPVASNILFSNCSLTFDDDIHKYIHVNCNNINWNKAENPYKADNIVFFNCMFRESALELGEVEDEFGAIRIIF